MDDTKETKKTYHPPQLSEYGDLQTLTQVGGSGSGDLANSYSFS